MQPTVHYQLGGGRGRGNVAQDRNLILIAQKRGLEIVNLVSPAVIAWNLVLWVTIGRGTHVIKYYLLLIKQALIGIAGNWIRGTSLEPCQRKRSVIVHVDFNGCFSNFCFRRNNLDLYSLYICKSRRFGSLRNVWHAKEPGLGGSSVTQAWLEDDMSVTRAWLFEQRTLAGSEFDTALS